MSSTVNSWLSGGQVGQFSVNHGKNKTKNSQSHHTIGIEQKSIDATWINVDIRMSSFHQSHSVYRLVYWEMSVYENSVFYFGCLSQTLLLVSGVKGHLSDASVATSSPLKKIFLSRWQDHTPPPNPLCSWLCRANNQPWVPMFSYSRLKSLKALLDGTVVNSCLFWELLGFLPEFLSRRKRGLISPQPEQEVAFTAADWNGKPGSDPPPKSSHVKRDEVSVICSNLTRSKSFLKIQNYLFKLMKEEARAIRRAKFYPWYTQGSRRVFEPQHYSLRAEYEE